MARFGALDGRSGLSVGDLRLVGLEVVLVPNAMAVRFDGKARTVTLQAWTDLM